MDACTTITVNEWRQDRREPGQTGRRQDRRVGNDHRIINDRTENYGAYIVIISK